MKIKYAAIAMLLAATPAFAAGPSYSPGQQPKQAADLQSIALDKQGFVAAAQHVLVGVDQMLQELTALRSKDEQLEAENAQLKDQLARAAPPAPAPMSTAPPK